MSFDGTGGRGPSPQDLFGFLRGLRALGSDPNDDPIAQAQADIARRARLPKVGGLFGGDYARFMADNPPPSPNAQPGSCGFPRGMPGPGGEPRPGDWYADRRGLAQAGAAPPSAPVAAAADSAYRSARRGEGKSTVYVRPDGREDVYDGGTMAWRNNNPGNLNYGDFARSHGAIGSYTNDNGTFAVFPDEAAGVSAMRELLKIPKYQQKTVDQVIKSYAPATQNNTPAYQAFVRAALGVVGLTRLDTLSADQFDKLIETVRKKEGARAGTVTSRPGAAR